MFDKDKFKESLTTEDIKTVLNYFHADYYENEEGVIISETICHNKANGSHKLYYYSESHSFYCYTHCGAFDIYGLVKRVSKTRGKALNFSQAIRKLGDILQRPINRRERVKGVVTQVKLIEDWDWLKKIQRKESIVPQLNNINESILNYFDKLYPSSWYEEGISIETMEKYKIMFYPEVYQTIIPHYKEDGSLIGIRSRNWRKDLVKKAKYIPTYIGETSYNHPLRYSLYGLYQNKETIKKKKKVMIVEGEKSCLLSDTFYGEDNFVVALCGSNLSKYQLKLLLDLGVEEVIIALDKDYFFTDTEEYESYMKKVMRIARMTTPYCRTYHLTDTQGILGLKESPLDVGKEDLEKLMKKDKHLITMKNLEEK